MEQTPGNSIVARADFIACDTVGDEWEMVVRIYLPEPDPESDNGGYRCQVEIAGFMEPFFAYGIDSLQAVGLAFASIRREIEQLQSEGWMLLHPDQNNNEPMPFAFAYCGDQNAAPWLQAKE